MVNTPTYAELEQKIVILEKEIVLTKQATKALRDSEYKLNNHLQNTPIGVITWDLNFRVIEWNPAAEYIFGYYKEETIGKHPTEIILPEKIKEMVDGIFRDLISDKGGGRSTNENLTKDGKRILCDWYNTPLKDADGKVIGVASLVHDITRRRQTEEALRTSDEKFKRIFDNLQDGYLWADNDGSILLANTVAAKILGYDLQELMQKNMAQDIYFVPEERETVKEIMFQNGKIENYELTFKRKDGQSIIVEANSHLIYENNQPKSIEGTFKDITSRKRAETEKANLEKQLQQIQKVEAIGALAGGIAHDFNNILAAIIGYSELLKEDMNGDELSKHFINQILQGSYRAKKLVEQILLFSRQGEHKTIQVEITPLIKEVIKMLTASLPSTIRIQVNILTTNNFVLADPTQIHQVLMNLCTNSAHAMREKGGTLSIEIGQIKLDQDAQLSFPDQKTGDYLKLQIKDTGHGIPPEVVDKIFDPFFSTKPRGEGTGLGLAVVHGIIKECGGGIKVYSEPGKGTTFLITLPLINKEEQDETVEISSIPGGVEHVLFVDDEQALIDIGKMMLERLGYKVTAISDSRTAWQVFQKDPNMFDMVITDKTMPGLTGLELSKKVIELCPEKPIIMCTGFGDDDSIEQAKKIGIRDYIRKPILKIKIAETIRNVFDQPDERKV